MFDCSGTSGDYDVKIVIFFLYKKISKKSMKYLDYERAFSAARLNKYLTACGGNSTKALILYRHNVKLCQKLYGMLALHPQKSIVNKTIADLIASGRYTNDRVVSSASFGFWTYLFTKKPFWLGGQSLLKVFPAKVSGLGQRAIYNELMAIKNFRNRIANHEPICFDTNGYKSIGPAQDSYNLIVRYVNFLGYSENHLYFGLDVLPNSILERIDRL
jgi:hypothetical protein